MKVASRTSALRFRAAFVAALGLAACSGRESQNVADSGQAPAAQDTATMSGMEGMSGMQGMADSGMMGQMQAHMRTMNRVSPDSMRAFLPLHREMMANMLTQFEKDMRDMGMTSDVTYKATADSLRKDLTRMTNMSASELQQFMPAHHARVMRFMGSHRAMMEH